ncbi:hypothetical protein SteCoe_6920 [Stentor coeruleus]|uniref:Uncharacterized protein n=1 Tax=Stentor coeruleus TaxID=5963 RepID=A0A1R2CNT4_9CILI|nr:hypothetical protein SteCoe_6920 [Stentor coeruleus]
MQTPNSIETLVLGNSSQLYPVLDFMQNPDAIRYDWTSYIEVPDYYLTRNSYYSPDYIQEDTEMLIDTPELPENLEGGPSYTELRNLTTYNTVFTSGTNLDLSPSRSQQNSRIDDIQGVVLFPSPNQNSEYNDTQSSTQIGNKNNQLQLKIGLKRVRVSRPEKLDRKGCPARLRLSPIRWWLGERLIYENGLIRGKEKRINV